MTDPRESEHSAPSEIPRLQGLWNLMQKRTPQPRHDEASTIEASPVEISPAEGQPHELQKKELPAPQFPEWTSSLANQEQQFPQENISPGKSLDHTRAQTSGAPRGLWRLMGVAVPQDAAASPSDSDVTRLDASDQTETYDERQPASFSSDDSTLTGDVDSADEEFAEYIEEIAGDSVAVSSDQTTPESALASTPLRGRTATARQASGWFPLTLGLVALPLSALAFLPDFRASLPAAALGFLALGLSLAVWTQPRISIIARRRALAGGVAAGLALLAGPLFFAPAGNRFRFEMSVLPTQQHLEQIGDALQQFHAAERNYPIGGTTITLADGERRGGHGWMTRLLPFIGREDVHQQIRLDLPFDDDVNRTALGTTIETYLTATGDARPTPGGYAVSHFAGVGGRVVSPNGEEVPAGIFALNVAIRQRDLTRGLTNSWIAGEVPPNYPPWGDPENWRTVDRGLNRDSRGFGNAAGDGGMLLFADGRVRFFGSQTDPRLLRQLSTR